MIEILGRTDKLCICLCAVMGGSIKGLQRLERGKNWKENKKSSLTQLDHVKSQQFLMVSNYQFPWKGI